MSGTANIESHEADFLRPDISIPLVPLPGLADFFLRVVIGLREASFARAHSVTLFWSAATIAILVAGQTVVVAELASPITGAAGAVALYVLIRVTALTLLEKRQRTFETHWLHAESERLREHPFDIMRFSLQIESPPGSLNRRVFDLTRPDDVHQLLSQQIAERNALTRSRARVEFTYWPSAQEKPVLESVHRELTDIEFYPTKRPIMQPLVRFPEAHYGSRDDTSSSPLGRRRRTTYWFLTGVIRITTSAPRAH